MGLDMCYHPLGEYGCIHKLCRGDRLLRSVVKSVSIHLEASCYTEKYRLNALPCNDLQLRSDLLPPTNLIPTTAFDRYWCYAVMATVSTMFLYSPSKDRTL